MTSDEISLRVNGQIYAGWKAASVKRSLTSLCSSFDLEVTETWLKEKGLAVPRVKRGDECEIFIGDELVIKGYVDSIKPAINKSERALSISGRSKAGDIVDCSCELEESQYLNRTVDKILSKIASKFGIKVTSEVSPGAAYKSAAIQPSETIYEVISRICRSRGLLVVSDPKGDLIITGNKGLQSGESLIEGQNALEMDATFDDSQRFSDVRVIANASGADDFAGETDDLSVLASAKDKQIKRYRPLVVLNETSGTAKDAKKRAEWEIANRRAKAVSGKGKVRGWRKSNGALWNHNEILYVRSAWLGIDSDMLVSEVEFNISNEGRTTTLSFAPKDAFIPQPEVPEDSGLWDELQ